MRAFFINSGYINHIADLPLIDDDDSAGIDGSESTAEWIWNNGFASVSSDQPAFEAWEPVGVYLHERLICGLGMPIGEFYDLERLSEVCKQKKRYTFYYSFVPLSPYFTHK